MEVIELIEVPSIPAASEAVVNWQNLSQHNNSRSSSSQQLQPSQQQSQQQQQQQQQTIAHYQSLLKSSLLLCCTIVLLLLLVSLIFPIWIRFRFQYMLATFCCHSAADFDCHRRSEEEF